MEKSIKGTRTDQNLLKSFAGESQARSRYTFFASVAKKEGYEQIAGVFMETAEQEKEHAKRFFKFLEGGMVEITASVSYTHLIESGFCQYTLYMFIDPGKYHMDMLCLGKTEKTFQVMQTGRIYERNLTHTDDADFRFISHTFHDAVELIRYAEKERTIDLVYLYTFRQGEDFLVMMNLALVGKIDLIRGDGYMRGLSHTAHKK